MRRYLSFSILAIGLVIGGCDAKVDRYPPNEVYALVVSSSRSVETKTAADHTSQLVESWFGTPEEPRWPIERMESDEAKNLVDPEHLLRAAGRVYSDQDNRHFGLYNEHCVTCHGVSGGGDGPASMLQNPYPRDFRAGVYKWKSTERAAKPLRTDLMAILLHGAPGSSMPSFSNIAAEDLAALVDYVIFLSVRGEFERRMLSVSVAELGYEMDEIDPEADLHLLSQGQLSTAVDAADAATEELNRICQSWVDAEQSLIHVSTETEGNAESIARGEELFHGKIANCAGCHGKAGSADLVTLDFDDWTKEFTTRLSITPNDRDAVKPFRNAGAPRPRQIHPRRLDEGVFRGGGNGEALFRRIVAGIAGTPMPGVMLTEEPSGVGLTAEQVWDIVHYVQSLD